MHTSMARMYMGYAQLCVYSVLHSHFTNLSSLFLCSFKHRSNSLLELFNSAILLLCKRTKNKQDELQFTDLAPPAMITQGLLQCTCTCIDTHIISTWEGPPYH